MCFILFKVVKVYTINLSNFEKKLICNNSLRDSNFFINFNFDALDWTIFKNNFFKIQLKKSFFDKELNKIFQHYYPVTVLWANWLFNIVIS